MSQSVRFGLPETVIASDDHRPDGGGDAAQLAAAHRCRCWSSAPLLIVAVRRYLKRAPKGYITEGGTYSLINSTLTETVEGARTVEALGLQRRRIELGRRRHRRVRAGRALHDDAAQHPVRAASASCTTLPLVLVLMLGGWGYVNGWVTLGQITAATLYVQALVEPLDRLIRMLDRLQVGIASTSRLLGIAAVPQDREPGDARPAGNRLVGAGPAVRVPRRPRRAARRRPRPAAGRAAGDRRAERLGQVDPGPAAVAGSTGRGPGRSRSAGSS